MTRTRLGKVTRDSPARDRGAASPRLSFGAEEDKTDRERERERKRERERGREGERERERGPYLLALKRTRQYVPLEDSKVAVQALPSPPLSHDTAQRRAVQHSAAPRGSHVVLHIWHRIHTACAPLLAPVFSACARAFGCTFVRPCARSQVPTHRRVAVQALPNLARRYLRTGG